MNLQDKVHSLARKSMVAAANRWRCQYIEVLDISANVKNPGYLKLWAQIESFEQSLLLSKDMLISADCPNIFELLKPPAAVKQEITEDVIKELSKVNISLKTYFNTDVMLLSNTFYPDMVKARKLCEKLTVDNNIDLQFFEHTIFNIIFKDTMK